MTSPKSKLRPGFTLIEIISVVAISTLIFGLILQIYDVSQVSFRQSSNLLELAQNGRVVLDRLSRELRQANLITTPLPIDQNQPNQPAPSEIMFEDGHAGSSLQYLRYFLATSTTDATVNEVHRQRIVYFFPSDPNTFVPYNAVDPLGQTLQSSSSDQIIAQNVASLSFYGQNQITIDLLLKKRDYLYHLLTTIWSRNARYGQG